MNVATWRPSRETDLTMHYASCGYSNFFIRGIGSLNSSKSRKTATRAMHLGRFGSNNDARISNRQQRLHRNSTDALAATSRP
jgi:TnpA family transposase